MKPCVTSITKARENRRSANEICRASSRIVQAGVANAMARTNWLLTADEELLADDCQTNATVVAMAATPRVTTANKATVAPRISRCWSGSLRWMKTVYGVITSDLAPVATTTMMENPIAYKPKDSASVVRPTRAVVTKFVPLTVS